MSQFSPRTQAIIATVVAYTLIVVLMALGFYHRNQTAQEAARQRKANQAKVEQRLAEQDDYLYRLEAKQATHAWVDAAMADTVAAIDKKLNILKNKQNEKNATVSRFTDVERQRYFTEHYPDPEGEAALRRAGYFDAATGRPSH
jgi:acyl-CoA reductase-like NAD-dependent aldehyde dehydrogenase